MTFPNTSFYEASTGRISFQPILVGWGRLFLTAIVEGLVQVRINCAGANTKLDISINSVFFFYFFFLLLMCPSVRFVTSHPARVTRVRQLSKKAGFILERKKPPFKPVKLIWSINKEMNKQIKTGIIACYSRLLKAFDIDFPRFSQIVTLFTLLLKEML